MKKQKLKNTSLKFTGYFLAKAGILTFLLLLLGFSPPLLGQDQDLDPCSTIEVISTIGDAPNSGIPDGILISNPITNKQAIRIYDENWQQIDECTSSECGNPYIYEASAGRYFVQVQLFNEDDTWLCQADPIEVIVRETTNPCETFCDQALIEFQSQADIDAFCGCEVLKGDVRITGNVTSLQPLNGLKKVVGFLAIFNTELSDFSGLETLESLNSDLYVGNNPMLKNFKGLENIENIKGTLAIESNSILETLDGLTIQTARSLTLAENDALINIEALKNITTLGFISITGNEKLPNLEGLNNLTNLGDGTTQGGGFSSLVIGGNAGITTLSALSNLKTIDENLIVEYNAALTECCGIAHLIDDDPNNGQANSAIMISNNLAGCNSVEDILENCQSSPPDCDAIALSINPNNRNTIDIAGLTTPHYIVKVYDERWNQLLSCTDDCTVVGAYDAGLYRIHVQLYDKDWQYICETDFLEITIAEENAPIDCADIMVNIGGLQFDNGTASRAIHFDVYTPANQVTLISITNRNTLENFFACGLDCADEIDFTILEGEYIIQIVRHPRGDAGSELGCERWIFVDVPANPCTDQDGDYICDFNDCDDSDPTQTIQLGPGAVCDDLNPNTENDVIQEDGCMCKGTFIGEPEPVSCEDIVTTISDLIIENGQARREVTISFDTPEMQRTGVYVLDRRQNGVIIDCGICESPQEFTLTQGEYVIIVDRSYLDVSVNPLGCSETFYVDVPLEPCTDNDGDYLCDYNECNDEDPNVVDLKFPAGTPCNDEDDTTKDDVIQEDGCTCLGTPISDNPCDNISLSLTGENQDRIVVDGRSSQIQLLTLYDSRWNKIWDGTCDKGNPLSTCEAWGPHPPGLYRVYGQMYDENWQYICQTDFLEIEIPESGNESRKGEDFLNEKEIVLFPNPALHTLNIKTKALQDKKGSIQIYNTFGQLVQEIPSKVFNQEYESIEVGDYENGLYLMTIKLENSRILSKRFLVENLK